MGSINNPPMSDLADALKRKFGIRYFVETGTYLGYGLDWAARNFEKTWTIEVRADYLEQARANSGNPSNVEFLLGDSAQRLPEVCSQLAEPALFWLDAHAGAGYFADEDRCPLIDELRVIGGSAHQHIILIDDARAFIAPPPPPFVYQKWPPLDQIMRVLQEKHDYHVVVINDCMVCVPQSGRDVVAEFVFKVRPSI